MNPNQQFGGSSARGASPRLPTSGQRTRSSTLTGLISSTMPSTLPLPNPTSLSTSPLLPPQPNAPLRAHNRTTSTAGLIQSPPAKSHLSGLKSPSPGPPSVLSFSSSSNTASTPQDDIATSYRRHSSDKLPSLSRSPKPPSPPRLPKEPPKNSSRLEVNVHKVDASLGSAFLDRARIPWAEVGDIVEVRAIRAEGDEWVMTGGGGGEEGEGSVKSAGGVRRRKKRKGNGSFLFRVEENGESLRKVIQYSKGLSVAESVAQVFSFANRHEVELFKVEDPKSISADHLSLHFSGQYLGRADMWRIGMFLEGKCVFVGEKLELGGVGRVEVRGAWVGGKKVGGVFLWARVAAYHCWTSWVIRTGDDMLMRRAGQVSSALITGRTKTVFRSKSAQSYIFIQLCRETYEFDEDGERFYEKALYGFLPELFTRWKATQANHVVTIILFARVIYTPAERDRLRSLGATGEEALLHDPHLGWYKDFYKVVVDFESRAEWQTVIPELKREVMRTHAEILLNHHLEEDEEKEVKIMGRLSFAHEGNVLECLNLVLNPFDENYIDRDLSRTGLSMLMVTPGSGRFSVSKQLLRLTTERMIDHGICLDLVCLTQVPLHTVPVFSFWSKAPTSAEEIQDKMEGRDGIDPLYFDAPETTVTEDVLSYTIAFWVYCSFYSKSNDRPHREDRFIPRCKMYEVQMLGLLEHDLTSVSIPMLEDVTAVPENPTSAVVQSTSAKSGATKRTMTAEERRSAMIAYDAALFGQTADSGPRAMGKNMLAGSRGSGTSLGNGSGGQIYSTSYQSLRLPTFEEKADSDMGSRASSYKDRDHPIHGGLMLSNTGPSSRHANGSTASVTPVAGQSPNSRRLSRSPVKSMASRVTPRHDSSGTSKGSKTPPSRMAPSVMSAFIPSTPATQILRNQTSRSSISSKKTAPVNWLSMFTGVRGTGKATVRAAPSQPMAAVETISRHDVSNNNSPTAAVGAKLGVHASPAGGSPLTLSRTSKLPVIDIGAPTPPPPDKKFVADISTSFSQPIMIEQKRGPSADSRRRNLARNHRNDTTSPEHKRSHVPGSTRQLATSALNQNQHSASWKAAVPSMVPQAPQLIEINPCRPFVKKRDRTGQARKWQHALPRPTYEHHIKWDSLCAAACLPLTTEFLPGEWQLSNQYEMSTHEVDVDTSFLLRPEAKNNLALEVMRELASQRLSQNFQFITAPHDEQNGPPSTMPNMAAQKGAQKGGQKAADWRRMHLKVGGASEVLKGSGVPLYLSTSNYVHSLLPSQLTGTIMVECFTRKIQYSTQPIDYQCLVWPRQRTGYQTAQATFKYPSLANRQAFSYLDRLITGKVESLTDDLKYWRTRFILIPSDRPPGERAGPIGEPLKAEEIHILGARRVLDMISKQRWKKPEDPTPPPPRLLVTWLDPSACILDDSLMSQLNDSHAPRKGRSTTENRIKDALLPKIAEAMRHSESGLKIGDLWWQRMQYQDSFTGEAFLDWLQQYYGDIPNRESATEWGTKLLEQGLIEHSAGHHGFLDGHYFYRLREEYGNRSKNKKVQRWFTKGFLKDTAKAAQPTTRAVSYQPSHANPFGLSPPDPESGKMKGRKRKIKMSQTMIIDLDTGKNRKSDRAEVAVLHSDIIHNPANGFHIELNWLGVSVGLLDETRQRWAREAERYGLRLVEAPVEQIKDISRKCAYRACFPIKLALAPPSVDDLDLRLPEAIRTTFYFEYAILTRMFGFVLDVEANTRYPDDVTVEYSYRKAVFDHSQFVHNTGLALVQCVGGTEGFLWSDNRLFFSSATRSGSTSSTQSAQQLRQQEADKIRRSLEEFCADPVALAKFYEEAKPPLPVEGDALEFAKLKEAEGEKVEETVEKPGSPSLDDEAQERYLEEQIMWV